MKLTAQTKRLQRIFEQLAAEDRSAVIAFAEYLQYRRQQPQTAVALAEPVSIPRPQQESVPAALKRLRLTYPMLDAADLLAEASDLLSQHLMLGRSAVEVIDDMEALFSRHYQAYRDAGSEI